MESDAVLVAVLHDSVFVLCNEYMHIIDLQYHMAIIAESITKLTTEEEDYTTSFALLYLSICHVAVLLLMVLVDLLRFVSIGSPSSTSRSIVGVRRSSTTAATTFLGHLSLTGSFFDTSYGCRLHLFRSQQVMWILPRF